MLWQLFVQILASILGIYTATKVVPGVALKIIPGETGFLGVAINHFWQILVIVGIILGLVNYFIKPILKIISLPLRILTLGLFTIVINMAIIWAVDVLFPEFIVSGITPLFWTSIIVGAISFILKKWLPDKSNL